MDEESYSEGPGPCSEGGGSPTGWGFAAGESLPPIATLDYPSTGSRPARALTRKFHGIDPYTRRTVLLEVDKMR